MSPTQQSSFQANPYDVNYGTLTGSGLSDLDAAIQVAETYLDGKPARRGKHKVAQVDRDSSFWSAAFLKSMAPAFWSADVARLVLARYLAQTRVLRRSRFFGQSDKLRPTD